MTDDLFEIMKWCKTYHREGTMPQSLNTRFGIGLYQIGQAMSWASGPCQYQGFIAAAMHWIMVSETLDLPIETFLGQDIRTLRGRIGDSALLHNIAKAQQQLIYELHGKGSTRKSRYSADKLCQYLSICIKEMITRVPVHYRAQAFHDEMQIVVGDLVRKEPT